MQVFRSEFVAGLVAFFSFQKLAKELGIKQPDSPMPRSGPMVLLWTDGTHSWWAEITTRQGSNRFEILDDWRCGGLRSWQTERQYLNGTLYYGLNDAFAEASRDKDRSTKATRARVNRDGMAAILKWWKIRKGD